MKKVKKKVKVSKTNVSIHRTVLMLKYLDKYFNSIFQNSIFQDLKFHSLKPILDTWNSQYDTSLTSREEPIPDQIVNQLNANIDKSCSFANNDNSSRTYEHVFDRAKLYYRLRTTSVPDKYTLDFNLLYTSFCMQLQEHAGILSSKVSEEHFFEILSSLNDRFHNFDQTRDFCKKYLHYLFLKEDES